jgi:Tfp pilus assembly protein FimT
MVHTVISLIAILSLISVPLITRVMGQYRSSGDAGAIVGALPGAAATAAVATPLNSITAIPFHTVTVSITRSEVGRGGRTITLVSGITG